MPLFELETASLGESEGQGYAFTKRTVFGKAIQGVMFVEGDEVESLKDEDELVFEGTVYHQRRTKGPRIEEESFPVEIVDVTSTGLGQRITFEAVDNPN